MLAFFLRLQTRALHTSAPAITSKSMMSAKQSRLRLSRGASGFSPRRRTGAGRHARRRHALIAGYPVLNRHPLRDESGDAGPGSATLPLCCERQNMWGAPLDPGRCSPAATRAVCPVPRVRGRSIRIAHDLSDRPTRLQLLERPLPERGSLGWEDRLNLFDQHALEAFAVAAIARHSCTLLGSRRIQLPQEPFTARWEMGLHIGIISPICRASLTGRKPFFRPCTEYDQQREAEQQTPVTEAEEAKPNGEA